MRTVFAIVVGLMLAPSPAPALEIAAGSMLGPRYKADRFYIRRSPRGRWLETYSERPYRKQARGKVMALRLAQGLFDDEWLTESSFDPYDNTGALIDALDIYKAHGVLGVVVSLQGADPSYPKGANGVARLGAANPGKNDGSLISAFEPDGSLKPAWTARLERLIRAADERGMIVFLIYFHPSQDEVLSSPQAVVRAAENATRWLIERNLRNVVIDVADAWDAEGDTWDHGRFISRNIARLIEFVREQFNGADFSLPIGAATGDSMVYPSSLARLCDVVMLHGNSRSAREKLIRIGEYRVNDRPVFMIDDDNGRHSTRAELAREAASGEAAFRAGAGWTYNPWGPAQRFPFRYSPGPTSEFEDRAPPAKREAAYFRAVLEQIAKLTLRKPPSTQAKNNKKKRR